MTSQQRISNLENMWKRSQDDLAAERIENTKLREAFVTMERGYNLAAAVLDTAATLGHVPGFEDLIRLVVDRAAWEAWRGRQT